MKNIQIEKLSNAYTIRRLTDADVPMLRNDQYFRYCGGNRILHTPPPSLHTILQRGAFYGCVPERH